MEQEGREEVTASKCAGALGPHCQKQGTGHKSGYQEHLCLRPGSPSHV